MANRRTFIKNVSLAGAAVAAGSSLKASDKKASKINIGVIGTGLRGQDHIELLLRRNDVNIVCICDVDETMLNMTKKLFTDKNAPQPKIFTGNNYSYRDLIQTKGLDAILIATPWEWHMPMITETVQAGIKYVASEVVVGITLEDHWKVVRTTEQYKAQVMMLENVCYRRDVMAILNMVKQNIFGELIHLQGGYQHDLRGVKFNDGKTPYDSGVEFGEKGFSEAKWRTLHSVHRNGDLYPTHGVGPIAMMTDINRGNRFISLSSFDSKARGLHDYIVKKGSPSHPNANVRFKLGDVVTTQIKCANGETILLQHDTDLPRPYSLGFRVQGTNGLWMDVNRSIYVEGTGKPHQWQNADEWLKKYDHPLWKKYEQDANGAGHGGMDFFVVNAFIESVKRNEPTPLTVYDAATWSAITPLSEHSIELGNATVEFPDFTSGQWMYSKNSFGNGEY